MKIANINNNFSKNVNFGLKFDEGMKRELAYEGLHCANDLAEFTKWQQDMKKLKSLYPDGTLKYNNHAYYDDQEGHIMIQDEVYLSRPGKPDVKVGYGLADWYDMHSIHAADLIHQIEDEYSGEVENYCVPDAEKRIFDLLS